MLSIDKAVTNKEIRTAVRLSRQVRKYRNVIKGHHLLEIVRELGIQIDENIFRSSPDFNSSFVGTLDIGKNLQSRLWRVLEVESFVRTLIVLFLWREQKYTACLNAVNTLLMRIDNANRRTLDAYGALMFFFYLRLHQKNNTDLQERGTLLDAYNRACVRNDELGQSTLLNLLLRNYLKHNHIDAAYNLIEKSSFP